jgi:hypothetical protein
MVELGLGPRTKQANLDGRLIRSVKVVAGARRHLSKQAIAAGIPDSAAHALSLKVASILKAWNFPGECHVHYDKQASDFVIDGRPRASRGKGLRAISHAAVNRAGGSVSPHINRAAGFARRLERAARCAREPDEYPQGAGAAGWTGTEAVSAALS